MWFCIYTNYVYGFSIMATIQERLVVLEVKITNLQRTLWALIIVCGGQVGIDYLPLIIELVTALA